MVAIYTQINFPDSVDEESAVTIAYQKELDDLNKYIASNVCVLVECDKALNKTLIKKIQHPRILLYSEALQRTGFSPIELITKALEENKSEESWIFIMDRFDFLNHRDIFYPVSPIDRKYIQKGSEDALDLLYKHSNVVLVGLLDRSETIPEILRKRFDRYISIHNVPRHILTSLVTKSEAAKFSDFDEKELYKHVHNFNAIQLRRALRYACNNGKNKKDIYHIIEEFRRESEKDLEIPDISIRDIGGYEEVKVEIYNTIKQINKGFNGNGNLPEYFSDLIPRGFLFHGLPGTGKTMFSKAIARELNAVIQIVSGPEIISKWVGESEKRLREIFEWARKNAPAVIVFEEIDAIAGKRGEMTDSATRGANALVNQLLTEMDGFKNNHGVLVIGTTNRANLIDEALLRLGRFRPIHFPKPNENSRRAILDKYMRKYEMYKRHPQAAPDWVKVIAKETEGFTGDDLHTIVKEVERKRVLSRIGSKFTISGNIDRYLKELGEGGIGDELRNLFERNRVPLLPNTVLKTKQKDIEWIICEQTGNPIYIITKKEGCLEIRPYPFEVDLEKFGYEAGKLMKAKQEASGYSRVVCLY